MKKLKKHLRRSSKVPRTSVNKRRSVSNHNRKVHKTHGIFLLSLWVLVILTSLLLIAGYIKHHHTLKVRNGGVTLKIDKVKYDDVGSPPFEAPSGWKFIIIHAVLKNNTDKNFPFAPVIQTYMSDSAEHNYTMSPGILKDPIVAGNIPPHGSRSGELSYLVPNNAKGITLKFQP
jgi:hypothetical protein